MPGTILAGENAAWLDLGEEVLRIAVEFEEADLEQRERGLGPHLGQIEGVEGKCPGLSVVHHLDKQSPPRKSACLDVLEQVALMGLAILADQSLGRGIRQILDALLAAEVELHPDPLVLGVEETIGMAAEAMHVAKAARNTALAHDDGDLVKRLWQQRPKVPVVIGAAHAGTRIALDCVIEIRETQRIPKEEHRCVVADYIPVAFLGIELQCEAADVAFGIGCAALSRRRSRSGANIGVCLPTSAKIFALV